MFYEEMIRIDIYKCSFEYSSHYGKEYLKCSGTFKLKNRGFTLNNTVYNSMSTTIQIYGEHEELVKIQEALIEALNSGKKCTPIYTDINFSYKRTKASSGNWLTFVSTIVCDFIYCNNVLTYRKLHKDKEKYGAYKIILLEKELKAEKAKVKKIKIEPKKKKISHRKGSTKRISKNYDAIETEIEDVELNDFMEELKEEMNEELEIQEEKNKPKENILDSIFGETKW